MQNRYIKVTGDGTVMGTSVESVSPSGGRVQLQAVRLEVTTDERGERAARIVLAVHESFDLDLSEYTGPVPGVVDVDEYNATVATDSPDDELGSDLARLDTALAPHGYQVDRDRCAGLAPTVDLAREAAHDMARKAEDGPGAPSLLPLLPVRAR